MIVRLSWTTWTWSKLQEGGFGGHGLQSELGFVVLMLLVEQGQALSLKVRTGTRVFIWLWKSFFLAKGLTRLVMWQCGEESWSGCY